MGNQLVALAPSQIFPVEHYIQDIQELARHDTNLGSTRFFKVARCSSDSGSVVVKVFVIHDSSLGMKQYQERVLELLHLLRPTFNCVPFSKAILTEKAGFLIRQFSKYSVYDRISTRPFLTLIEKKWLAFQLLLAVDQAHGVGVCHGDIKLENVMVTTWGWLTLTDFASFKPVFLPEDNPADFSYFFDSSRRRTCYIAPERFVNRSATVESSSSGSQVLEQHEELGRGEASTHLLPSMDVFSAGCCLAELFCDGNPPFDFSQLLAYRVGEFSTSEFLKKIDNPDMRLLIEQMTLRDPSSRRPVAEYLAQQRGKGFPETFYSFLHSYVGMFSRPPLMSADQKIRRIYKDLDSLDSMLTSDDSGKKIDSGSLLVLTGVVTASVRALELTSSQEQSLSVLQWLAVRQSSEVILERILPFITFYFLSPVAAVRTAAIHALVNALGAVRSVPRGDANTFPEYILPHLLPLCQDPSVAVRAALAHHLATIAELASTFLDMASSGAEPEALEVGSSYDTEVSALHELLARMVTLLLEDSNNAVKQVVVSRGAARLAVFFGRQRANDVLLSHMITFLNDKTDCQLRFCFYDNIAGVASFVGWQCSPILRPLLEQGLGDTEEFVVARAITAMADLVSQGLLEKVATFDMMRSTVPFLLHSNLWVRHASVGLVAALASRLDTVEVQVKLGSMLAAYMRQPLVQVERPALLLGQLREHVPRPVLEQVLRYQDTPGLLNVLEERQTARRLCRGSGLQVVYPDLSPSLRQLFGRLAEAGMLPGVEEQLLGLREYVIRVGKARAGARESGGKVDCTLLATRKFSERLAIEGPRRGEGETAGEERGEETKVNTEDSQPLLAPSQVALTCLVTEKRSEHSALSARADTSASLRHPSWRPRGQLVAHLAEHRGSVTRLASVPETTLFASTGADGSLRVWDCAKMEGRALANKNRLLHHRGTHLDSLAASGQPQVLATGGRDGSISLFHLEKQSTVGVRQVALEEEGGPVELQFSQLSSSPLLLYSTAFGSLVGWDMRKPGEALRFSFKEFHCTPSLKFTLGFVFILLLFRFDGDLRQGLTTAMCLGTDETWVAAATSSGVVTVWDLRFRLRVSGFVHPGKARVRRLVAGPQPGQLLAAVQGNNEVVW